MKRAFGLLVVLILVMGIGCAAAEQRVNLPDSAYSLALPDEMKYSAPGPQSTERFAYAAKKLGLEISFYRYDDNGWTLDALAQNMLSQYDDIKMTRVNGIEMIVYRAESATGDGMKAIGYVMKDDHAIIEITFWYANQKAADMTKTIMESIR